MCIYWIFIYIYRCEQYILRNGSATMLNPTFEAVPEHEVHLNTPEHIATHCNTLQHTFEAIPEHEVCLDTLQHTAIHCNTLQHIATHCNTLQLTFEAVPEHEVRVHTLQRTATHCNTLQHTEPNFWGCARTRGVRRVDTLQHTATHCNALQHTATHSNTHLYARAYTEREFLNYGVATISRIDKIIRLFCRILSLL